MIISTQHAARTGLKVALTVLFSLQLALPLPTFAATLEELLQQVKDTRAAEAQANAARVKDFTFNKANQAKLLADAEKEQAAAEARSESLSKEYDSNEKAITENGALLKQREGNLGELFGVTRQVAGDTANVFEQSIISAQYPDREEFLRTLATAKALPSITELERLWYEMQREMTATGRVVKYTGPVVQADGTTKPQELVRVGPFTAAANGAYLAYVPSLKNLQILARQPPSVFRNAEEKLQDAKEGYTRAVADPGRGVLVALYGERPNVIERIRAGQEVGYVIILVGLIGAGCWVYQLFFLVTARIKVRNQMRNLDHPSDDNPLGRVLLAFKGDPNRSSDDAEVAELRIEEATVREIPKLERFQALLRLAVAAGPLLGLIGTVIGMIITFQSITESGSSDPKLMAAGISQAMIATVLGLGIAIPLLFANAVLTSISKQITSLLDEQSSGLLAESIERRNA